MERDEVYDAVHQSVSDALAEDRKTRKSNDFSSTIWSIAGIWFLFLFIHYLGWARWVNQMRYSVSEDVPYTQVHQFQDRPPSDCDFLRSPIGEKNCHFKKHVDVIPKTDAEPKSVEVYWTKEEGPADD